MFNYIGNENSGYSVIAQVPKDTISNNFIGYVLAVSLEISNRRGQDEWVVWEVSINKFRGYWSGHYFTTYREAVKDMMARSLTLDASEII